MADRLSSLARGTGQGLTMNFGDEGIAALLAALPMADDKTGIPREYAAGSAQDDYLQTERNANTDAQRAFPKNYGAGQILGSVPLSLSVPGGRGLAAGAATGGFLGGLSGAGAGSEGTRGVSALRGAAVGGAMGGAVGGAPSVMRAIQELRSGPPPGGAAPAFAASSTQPVSIPFNRGSNLEQIQINRANMPPRMPSGEYVMPSIPRPGRTISEGEKHFLDDVAEQRELSDSALNQKLVDRSMNREMQRPSPLDAEAETAKYYAKKTSDTKDRTAGTIPPPRRRK